MIALLTVPGRSYYRATAEAIAVQAAEAKLDIDLFVDGTRGPEFVPSDWRVSLHPKGAPNNGDAFWRVLRAAVDADEGLVFFEDDLELTLGAVSYMASFKIPDDVALVSFMSPVVSSSAPWGLYRAPGLAFSMCQAMAVSKRAARALLAIRPHPVTHVADTDLAMAMADLRERWAIHVPDLVRHVGEVSVANPGTPLEGRRLGNRWPGASFDPRRQLRSAHELGLYR